MIKRITLLLFAIATLFSFQACNPDCETFATSNINLPPGPYEEGTELAITANPPGVLEGRQFHISFRGSTGGNISEIPTRFEPDLGAAVVEIPNGLSANASFLVDDPDCTGNLIPVGEGSSVVDASFFIDNPFFVTPTPPLIIIPLPPVTPPANIVNAWFSPNNRDYCIWFNPTIDTLQDGTIVEFPALIPAFSPNGIGPANGSVELAVGCSDSEADDRFYHLNPVSGFIDKDNNVIRIRIDRTSKNLGIEEMDGQFIDPKQLPAGTDYSVGGVCSADGSSKPNIMFLTSLQTGRQMILWRGAD